MLSFSLIPTDVLRRVGARPLHAQHPRAAEEKKVHTLVQKAIKQTDKINTAVRGEGNKFEKETRVLQQAHRELHTITAVASVIVGKTQISSLPNAPEAPIRPGSKLEAKDFKEAKELSDSATTAAYTFATQLAGRKKAPKRTNKDRERTTVKNMNKCRQCGLRCSTYHNKLQHEPTCAGEGYKKCLMCGARVRKSSLKDHKKTQKCRDDAHSFSDTRMEELKAKARKSLKLM